MPCTKKQRGLFFYLASKKRKTMKDKATMKGLAKKCEFKHSHTGGVKKMVKRKKCRKRVVRVGRFRCAKLSCRGRVLKRVKCPRSMKVSRKRTKARKSCKFGFRKGTKTCRKHPKRVIHVRAKRSHSRKPKARKGKKIPCGKAHSKCGKTHRRNKRYSWLRETRN